MNHVIVGAIFVTLTLGTMGSHANGQTPELPPIPKDDWRLQSVLLDLIPRCQESPLAAGHVIGAKPDPCVNNVGNGAYFVSASKDYSLRCGSWNCGAMIRIYLKTKRIPKAIDGQ